MGLSFSNHERVVTDNTDGTSGAIKRYHKPGESLPGCMSVRTNLNRVFILLINGSLSILRMQRMLRMCWLFGQQGGKKPGYDLQYRSNP